MIAELHPSRFARDEIVPSTQQDVLEVLQVGEIAWLVIGQSRIPNLSRTVTELPSRSVAPRTGPQTSGAWSISSALLASSLLISAPLRWRSTPSGRAAA